MLLALPRRVYRRHRQLPVKRLRWLGRKGKWPKKRTSFRTGRQ